MKEHAVVVMRRWDNPVIEIRVLPTSAQCKKCGQPSGIALSMDLDAFMHAMLAEAGVRLDQPPTLPFYRRWIRRAMGTPALPKLDPRDAMLAAAQTVVKAIKHETKRVM